MPVPLIQLFFPGSTILEQQRARPRKSDTALTSTLAPMRYGIPSLRCGTGPPLIGRRCLCAIEINPCNLLALGPKNDTPQVLLTVWVRGGAIGRHESCSAKLLQLRLIDTRHGQRSGRRRCLPFLLGLFVLRFFVGCCDRRQGLAPACDSTRARTAFPGTSVTKGTAHPEQAPTARRRKSPFQPASSKSEAHMATNATAKRVIWGSRKSKKGKCNT